MKHSYSIQQYSTYVEYATLCFRIVVLENTLESPLDCKEIKPVNPKGNQPWIFIGRTDAEAETPILWPPDAKNWLIWKEPDAGRDWGQEEKGTTEDEMVEWHHWLMHMGLGGLWELTGGQGGLVCCGSWGHKESEMNEWLNWTERLSGATVGRLKLEACVLNREIVNWKMQGLEESYKKIWTLTSLQDCLRMKVI